MTSVDTVGPALWERTVGWRRADENAGHSLARVWRRVDGWSCRGSEVLVGPEVTLSCSFRVDLDDGWVTRTVHAEAFGPEIAVTLDLLADDNRRWSAGGRELPGLTGCVDVDIAATPLTNTFPIRRLSGVPIGEEVTTPVAWVEVPSLRVQRVEQTYRRLATQRWRYSDPTHGAFTIEVDEHGLVTDYEGFAERVNSQ